jgi:hypothetical protein
VDLLDGPVQMGRGLGVDGDDVRARFSELLDVSLGFHDHQVHIDHTVGHLAHRVDDQWPDGDVGDKPAIHDVDVDVVGACFIDRLHLLAEASKVSGKNGRSDSDRAGGTRHGAESNPAPPACQTKPSPKRIPPALSDRTAHMWR